MACARALRVPDAVYLEDLWIARMSPDPATEHSLREGFQRLARLGPFGAV